MGWAGVADRAAHASRMAIRTPRARALPFDRPQGRPRGLWTLGLASLASLLPCGLAFAGDARPATMAGGRAEACLRDGTPVAGRLVRAGLDLMLERPDGERIPARIAAVTLQTVGDQVDAWTALVDSILSRPVLLLAQTGLADRWGRVPLLVQAGDGVLNARVLRAGLGRFRSGDVGLDCARLLERDEDAARQDGVGAWTTGALSVSPASEPQPLLEQVGRFVQVDGRVLGLGETKTRVYLNFGTVRSEDFTVSILKRNLRKFEASGMRWTSLEGRRVRIRGTLVGSGGPLLEVSAPEDIERLD